MQVKEAINKRKSVRCYQEKKVPDETLEEVLEAARLAPSRHNNQPWKYFVAKERKLKVLEENKIFKQDFVCTAPVVIVCAATPKPYQEHGKSLEDARLRACSDLSISSAFLVLRAEELGLGSCYVGLLDKERVKPLVGVPSDYDVHFAITLGFPGECPADKGRKPKDEVVEEA
jgi:nitroreductase